MKDSTRLALLAATLASCDRGAPTALPRVEEAPAFVAPGPARARQADAVRQNDACVACHPREAAEWLGSLHQRANIEPAYRRAFAIEPMPFCRSCHAPEADPFEAPTHDVSALGVGCVTCHVTGDTILSTTDDAPHAAPHAVLRDVRFERSEACGGCHQFRFPNRHGDEPWDFMQTTVREHAASKHAETSCAECHMPLNDDGSRSHRFESSRDFSKLRRALEVRATRASGARVTIELRLRNVGHAFPTGDLFRRVEVLVEAYGDDNAVVASDRRYLARHFELTPRGRALARDDRITDDGSTIEFDLGEVSRPFPIAYRVAYQRVAHPTGSDDVAAVLEADVVLSEGVLETH